MVDSNIVLNERAPLRLLLTQVPDFLSKKPQNPDFDFLILSVIPTQARMFLLDCLLAMKEKILLHSSFLNP